MKCEQSDPPRLSKSRFLAGLKCLKRLYFQVLAPELRAEPDELTQARFDQGEEVGKLACRAFAGGVLVNRPHWDIRGGVEATRRLLADVSVPAIFEATFLYENVSVRVDILERLAGRAWRCIEVKSSTQVKDEHIPDVAIQKLVVEGCGLDVAAPCLMHLSRDYVFDGGEYDLRRLFRIEDLSDRLLPIEQDLTARLKEQMEVLTRATAPTVEPGPQCMQPYECEFYDQCNEELPTDHVARLHRMRPKKIQELRDMGVERLTDIPDDFRLSVIQQRMVTCAHTGRPYFDAGVRDELAGLRYPLSFMDFETLSAALPRYAGTRAYDQIPFQWSVHVQPAPGADLQHYEFLVEDASDPREPFLASLLKVLEEQGGDGHIVVYHQSFERGRLHDLAEWLPVYARRIAPVQDRIWDLLPVVRKNIYHPEFGGSFSIKNVLPALVPGMSYDGMEVSEGREAGLAYDRMVRGDLSTTDRKRLRGALLGYCKQDTLAMVRLIEQLGAV